MLRASGAVVAAAALLLLSEEVDSRLAAERPTTEAEMLRQVAVRMHAARLARPAIAERRAWVERCVAHATKGRCADALHEAIAAIEH